MAGNNSQRRVRMQPTRLKAADDARAEDLLIDKSQEGVALPTLQDLMARVGGELLRHRWQTAPDPQRPLAGLPQLVSDNSAPEQQLSRIVELEIIPRLMMLHSGVAKAPSPARANLAITAAHVETLVHLAVNGDAARPEQFVAALIAEGAPLADIFLQLLTPAAHLMGQLWTDDVYNFSQVTVGLWRLQQLLHEQSRHFIDSRVQTRGLRTLLTPAPGAQHTFGVAMLGEFFTRDGWDAHYEPLSQWSSLHALLKDSWYDMLGVSVSVDTSVVSVASAILKLRKVSQNKNLFVMVGGPCAFTVPDLVQRCGADAMAEDAATAVSTANRWLISPHPSH